MPLLMPFVKFGDFIDVTLAGKDTDDHQYLEDHDHPEDPDVPIYGTDRQPRTAIYMFYVRLYQNWLYVGPGGI